MKREKWLTGLVSVLFGAVISFSGVMCLQSAFSLTVTIEHVLLGCAISALLFSAGFSVKWWYIPLLLLAPLAGYLWFDGSLSGSMEWVVYQISSSYDRAYGTGVFYWSGQLPEAGDATFALCAMGCLIAFVTAWSVCRKKPALWAALLALLPLAACFVVTDRVPRVLYLYLLLLSICVLLLSSLTRRRDPAKGNFLTVLVAVPVALGLLILFRAVPQSTYQGQQRADTLLQKVQQWAESVGNGTGSGASGGVDQAVELDTVGRLVQTHTPVMTVHADQTGGTLYLRQQGFQMYDGTSWYNEHGEDIYEWIQWEQLYFDGYVSVTTRNQYLMKFVPYYAKDVAVNQLGITENIQNAYSYTFELMRLRPNAPSAQIIENNEIYVTFPVKARSPDAILLPPETVGWAEDLVKPLIADKNTVQDRAEAVGDYVRGLAEYSRNTPRMPAGEKDFARWFATEAETGYCVHFATTAAVLLRAAGIQAQYVEGYVVRVEESAAATVYEDQAHAWVEYYDPAVGWRILECTPAEGVPGYVHVGPDGAQTQPQTQQTPQQLPEQPSQQQNAPTAGKKPIPPVLWWVLGILAAAALLLGQWQIRLRLKERRRAKGNTNQQAVQRWYELVQLCRLLKLRPAQQWYRLAQKAKFSQHVLTAQELAVLTAALEDCRKQLKRKPWYLQPIYTILFAIY